MISNVTTIKYQVWDAESGDWDTAVALTGGTSGNGLIGTDLNYGFKNGRSGSDKTGFYTNIGIDGVVITVDPDNASLPDEFAALKQGDKIKITVGNAIETMAFEGIVASASFVTYEERAWVSGEFVITNHKYFRVTAMPKSGIVEAAVA